MLNYLNGKKYKAQQKYLQDKNYKKKMCVKISLPYIYYVTRIEYIDRSIAITLHKALKP